MAQTIGKTRFCKLSEKIIPDQLESYLELSKKPKYICLRCFRLAQNKNNLCRPQKLKKLASAKDKKQEHGSFQK